MSIDPLHQARAACAERLREKGHPEEAAAFDAGERDETWAMRHEMRKMEDGDAVR